MTDQLDTAYDLIKAGQTDDAIAIVEPLIREDRDNEEAWWLLANASDDPSAKRNALHNVLRLTENDSRKEKAEILLQELDEPDNFGIDAPSITGMSAYQELDDVPLKQSGGLSCARLSLIFIGIVGVCAIAGIAFIFIASKDVFQTYNYPEVYDHMGVLEDNTEFSGALSPEVAVDAYSYSGEAGDTVILNMDYDTLGSPLIVVFDESTQIALGVSFPESSGQMSFSYQLPVSGDYLFTIHGLEMLGQNYSFGNYSLDVEIR